MGGLHQLSLYGFAVAEAIAQRKDVQHQFLNVLSR
jgi:hypothetical protein